MAKFISETATNNFVVLVMRNTGMKQKADNCKLLKETKKPTNPHARHIRPHTTTVVRIQQFALPFELSLLTETEPRASRRESEHNFLSLAVESTKSLNGPKKERL